MFIKQILLGVMLLVVIFASTKKVEAIDEKWLGWLGCEDLNRPALFKKIDEIELSSFMASFERVLTAKAGSFSLVSSKIFLDKGISKSAVMVSKGANYSNILYNIYSYILENPDMAINLKAAVTYIDFTPYQNSKAKKLGLSSELANSYLLATRYITPSDLPSFETIRFAAGLLQMLFLKETGNLEEYGKINYYPPLKQKLIIALANSDFKAVSSILNTPEIKKMVLEYKDFCSKVK